MLKKDLKEYIKAACSGIWIKTYEPEECAREIETLAKEMKAVLVVWDMADGFQSPTNPDKSQKMPNPIEPLLKVASEWKGLDCPKILALHNYHKFIDNVQVMQTLNNEVQKGKQTGTFFIVLSPLIALPIEIEKKFMVLEHKLPTEDALKELALEMSEEITEVSDEVIKGMIGLTRGEAELACALSLVRHKKLDPESIWSVKTQAVKKRGGISLFRSTIGFEALGGMENLKAFSKRLLRNGQKHHPKGILLLGPSGVGKSAYAKALGKEIGRPTLVLDIASMYSKHVGDTEQNIRQSLDTADAMGNVVLFIDEIEKSLSGQGSEGDSGVSSRLFGTLLTWLSDRDDRNSGVFFIATANDIKKLPPEFSRSGRFDGKFFIDLPQKVEREQIWKIHEQRYEVTGERPEDENYSGADIEETCRLAALLDVPLKVAAMNVIPSAITYGEQVRDLRDWAKNRCLSAEYSGYYQGERVTDNRRKLDVSDG